MRVPSKVKLANVSGFRSSHYLLIFMSMLIYCVSSCNDTDSYMSSDGHYRCLIWRECAERVVNEKVPHELFDILRMQAPIASHALSLHCDPNVLENSTWCVINAAALITLHRRMTTPSLPEDSDGIVSANCYLLPLWAQSNFFNVFLRSKSAIAKR